jgi:hypothetical protein
MIEIKPFDWEDEKYDTCGNTTRAILKIDRISIPLCEHCLEELNESISVFNNTIFCYQCKHFIMSRSGWSYGVSCTKDKDIKPEDAGFTNCRDCMNTCKDAIKNT